MALTPWRRQAVPPSERLRIRPVPERPPGVGADEYHARGVDRQEWLVPALGRLGEMDRCADQDERSEDVPVLLSQPVEVRGPAMVQRARQ